MRTIWDLQRGLNLINIDTIISDIIAENEGFIIEMIKDNLFQGQDETGTIVGRYSLATEGITRGKTGIGFPKKAGQVYNLYDTGETANRIKVRYKNGVVSFSNTSSNLDDLFDTIKRSGFINNPEKTLIGLQDQDISDFFSKLQEWLTKELNIRIENI